MSSQHPAGPSRRNDAGQKSGEHQAPYKVKTDCGGEAFRRDHHAIFLFLHLYGDQLHICRKAGAARPVSGPGNGRIRFLGVLVSHPPAVNDNAQRAVQRQYRGTLGLTQSAAGYPAHNGVLRSLGMRPPRVRRTAVALKNGAVRRIPPPRHRAHLRLTTSYPRRIIPACLRIRVLIPYMSRSR